MSRIRYVLADILYVAGRALGRIPRALRDGLRGFWSSLSIVARWRLLGAIAALAALALFLGLAVPTLPCEAPGGDSCPPADDAEDLAPSDALAYVHANLDPDTDEYREAARVAESLPTITRQIAARALALLPGPGGGAPSFADDIEPWFGGEVAVVALPARGRGAELVQLLEIDDSDGAAKFAREVAAGTSRTEDYRDVELSVDGQGLATAQVEGFLVTGNEAGVRSVIDTAIGATGADSLADDDAASEVRDELPDHRFAEAYVSREGALELIGRAGGVLGSLEPFVSPQSTEGAALALSADDRELRVAVRSELDPARTKSTPGFFAAFAPFEPQLPDRLSDDALAYLGLGDPQRTVTALLAQASAQAPGIASGFENLVKGLRRDGEIDIERDLLPALGGEAAFALVPRPEEQGGGEKEATIPAPPGEEPAPTPGAGPATPYLEFVANDVDEDHARKALAQLQKPVADAIQPATGLQAPVFEERDVGGVEAQSMRVSPTVELTYAVFDGLAVVATDPAAVSQLADGDGGLDRDDLFERATKDFGDEVSVLAFFDLGQLVAAAEQLGLAEDPAYVAFAPEIRTLSALGIEVDAGEDSLATDARLVVEPPTESAPAESEATPEPEAPTP